MRDVHRRGTRRCFVVGAPYYFSAFPDAYDGFEYGVVVGERVNVRRAPDTTSEVLTRLSYDIVRFLGTADASGVWVEVELADGKKGFMAPQLVKSPLGFRAGFEKINGRWRVFFFLAGD